MYDIKPKKAFSQMKYLVILLIPLALTTFLFIESIRSKEYVISFLLVIFPLLIIYAIVSTIKEMIFQYKRLKNLNENGKLVKCLKYRVLSQHSGQNKIVVEYVNDKGEQLTLTTSINGKTYDEDGYVDLLINETNPNDYIIRLEINRIGGNRKEDYYVEVYDNYKIKK